MAPIWIDAPPRWWSKLEVDKKYFRTPEGLLIKHTQTLNVIRQSPACRYCGAEPTRIKLIPKGQHHVPVVVHTHGNAILTKDHIVPKSAGGTNTYSNYQTCCSICNTFKGRAQGPVFCQGFARWALKNGTLGQWQVSCGGTDFSQKTKKRIKQSCMSHSTGFSRQHPAIEI